MSTNKQIVDRYMEGFRRSDHSMVLDCLTDDVEWVIPGMFHAKGKHEFDAQIENDAFVGKPAITVTRHTEQNDVVISEGTVKATKRDGGTLDLMFCDVFELRGAKTRKLTSYLMAFQP